MNEKRITYIRRTLLITWLVLGVVLLFVIQYANGNAEAERVVTAFVWVYIMGSCVLTGVLAGLKRRLNRMK